MKNSIRVIIFIIGITFLGSCSVSNVNQKLILGSWKYEKMGPYISGGSGATGDTVSEGQSLIELKNRYKDAGKEQMRELNETMYTGLIFKEDKTVSIMLRKGQIHGVWKMNSRGDKITVKDTATSKKYILHIVTIDSLQLKTENPVLDGKLQRNYRKQL
jgi:hypothetical protein